MSLEFTEFDDTVAAVVAVEVDAELALSAELLCELVVHPTIPSEHTRSADARRLPDAHRMRLRGVRVICFSMVIASFRFPVWF